VNTYSQTLQRKAEVETINAFSTHAGQDLLVEYVQCTQKTLRKVILVHGDPDPANALEAKLREIGVTDIQKPALYDALEL
jgi:metallo-beta-lactamase family protein